MPGRSLTKPGDLRQSFAGLVRLNPDGSRETDFVASADSLIYTLAIQGDGKVLAGGQITTLSGQPCKYLGRLNPDGTPDTD